jgi:hypothetical protein
MTNFTSKQKEIVARKMGYDGPMQGFDDFLSSSPSDALKYSSITSKFVERMAKGGYVKKYAAGGDVTLTGAADYFQKYPDVKDAYLATDRSMGAQQFAENHYDTSGLVEGRTSPVIDPAPAAPTASTYTATTTDTNNPSLSASSAPDVPTSSALVERAAPASQVATPTTTTANVIDPSSATADIKTNLSDMPTVVGAVSEDAKAKAAAQDPTTTAVGGLNAAQAVAGTVATVNNRLLQGGELVSSAVDIQRAEETLAKLKAEQGIVSEDMTVSGQLNKLLANFDAGKPPPWAAASMRAATAQMAARGLGASSLAGQAIIQAALEAASPIAANDAKTYETMALQNLSNRQAVAMELGRQRAAFLGQEFDQSFQARVRNAATVSDIANRNFDASVTIALENSRIASTTNLANLSSRNALVLATAAQVAALETSNLNNRQIVAIENSKAFLAMDIKNLDIKQQTAVFKAKTIADSLTSDTGFRNAALATNASNKLESDKINATLALTAQQFNATETNKVNLANMNAANELTKFNAQEANDRSEFNSRMSAEISVANAKILADVSTANTAAVNAANAVNAKNATELSGIQYAQETQVYRDLLSYSFKAGENADDRIRDIAVASIRATAETGSAETTADAASSAAWGKLALDVVKTWSLP